MISLFFQRPPRQQHRGRALDYQASRACAHPLGGELQAGLEAGLLCGGRWLRVRAYPSPTCDQRCEITHPTHLWFGYGVMAKIDTAKWLSSRPLLPFFFWARKRNGREMHLEQRHTSSGILGQFSFSFSIPTVEYTPPVLVLSASYIRKGRSFNVYTGKKEKKVAEKDSWVMKTR